MVTTKTRGEGSVKNSYVDKNVIEGVINHYPETKEAFSNTERVSYKSLKKVLLEHSIPLNNIYACSEKSIEYPSKKCAEIAKALSAASDKRIEHILNFMEAIHPSVMEEKYANSLSPTDRCIYIFNKMTVSAERRNTNAPKSFVAAQNDAHRGTKIHTIEFLEVAKWIGIPVNWLLFGSDGIENPFYTTDSRRETIYATYCFLNEKNKKVAEKVILGE